ncbi:hypothetical protein CAPTEDRAFT_193805 [Capitella teleta]|uniref:Uncharacterized protein n=1 Tax=Capitella teleta TaxID=283909 RepID=R7TDE5_CAPTE|nr:hypothetical protein CAPTEDRAFT_193805 [Capitella teleta]|eukprot:ELT89086.1 hypothetical protein CAPTEDRAFT_193805 [Capitella teleta]
MELPVQPATTHAICSSLCQILKPGFGPNGLKTMLCNSSGKIHITNCSCSILASLALSHPIGTLISKSAQQFHAQTGDGCSSFILILEAFFSQLRSLEASELTGTTLALAKIQNLLLREEILPALLDSELIKVGRGDDMMLKLIRTSLEGRYPVMTSQHFAQLICKMLASSRDDLETKVVKVLNNFRSKVIPGVCVRITTPVPMATHDVSFILMDFDPNEILESAATIEAKEIGIFMKWERKAIAKWTERFKTLKLRLVLNTCRLSDSFRSRLNQEGIQVLNGVDESEAELITSAFNIHALHSFPELDEFEASKFIAFSPNVQNIHVNGRNKLFFETQSISSLIICAPTEGQTKQLIYDLQNALKVILMWLDHDHVIPANQAVTISNKGVAMPGGGAFEIYMSSAFKDCATKHIDDIHVSQTLMFLHEAFLAIPGQLLINSYAPIKSLVHLKSKIAQFRNSAFVDGRDGRIKAATSSDGIVESVALKVCMVENVLQFMQQILRLNSFLDVNAIK